MTAKIDTPLAITTLEQDAFHKLLALWSVNRLATYPELENGLPERVVDISYLQAADGSYRAIVRVSFKLDPSFTSSTGNKLWLYAQELSTSNVASAFEVD